MQSPLMELEYRLRGSAVRWAVLAIGAVAVLLMLAAGVRHLRAAGPQRAALQGQLEQVLHQAPNPMTAPSIASDADFTAHLPETPPTADVVHMLSRACAQAGVALASVQAQHRPATPAQLGRTELTVLIRGAYPGARAALEAVLQRYPALTLQRLRMRRTASPTDLETSVTLSVWSRPVPAGRGS